MTVEILENGFHVEGRRMDFVSGEFHYWRVKRENWPKILSRLKALGIRMVSTYVPWNFHLTDHGFDFEGGTDAQRDLRGFIRLVGKGGFKMLLRPGPYIYAEWAFAGAPEHAFKHHKLSEEFRQMAADYIHAVCESCVVPNLATRGGPILAVQVDNEIDPWVRFYSDQMGLSGGQGPFKDYLT